MNESKKLLINYRIERAKESLEDAKILGKQNHWNSCINRLYYSCFYSVNALLIKEDLSSAKHSGVRSLFNKNFVKTNIISKEFATLYNDLYEYRQESDYKDFFKIDEEIVKPWILKTEEFINKIRTIINQ